MQSTHAAQASRHADENRAATLAVVTHFRTLPAAYFRWTSAGRGLKRDIPSCRIELALQRLILDHIRNARNFRELGDANRKAQGVNPLSRDTFTVYAASKAIALRRRASSAIAAEFSMASASVMTEPSPGSTVARPDRCTGISSAC